MQTLQTELNKYRTFVSGIRHTNNKKDKLMEQLTNSRSTGGQGSNKRYKRTSEELDQDIRKVDELVASGKYNQIEALTKMNLQSSVYHYRKRQWNDEPAKSVKPRKFAHRVRGNKENYAARKEMVMKELNTKVPVKSELQAKLNEIEAKYNTLKRFLVVEAEYQQLKKEVAEAGILG